MKRSHTLVISCACALVLALFGLTACGGNSSSSASTSKGTSTASSASTASSSSSTADPDQLTNEEIRGVFEQLVANMTEFYRGSTPAGEELYYAGGADGANAILAIVVPEENQSAIFVGPATVGENDNTLTVTDETTGSSVAFAVTSNDDGTISFSMGEEYGYTVMTKCKSSEIVDKLVEIVSSAGDSSQEAQGEAEQQEAQQ